MTPAVRQLEAAGVAHRVITYSVESSTTRDSRAAGYGRVAAAALGADPAAVFKTLVIVSDTDDVAMALVSSVDSLDAKAVAHELAWKKASLATTSVAERLSGSVIGGISPFGWRRQLPVVVDTRASSATELFVSGGRRGLEIVVSLDDLCAATGARVARIRRGSEGRG